MKKQLKRLLFGGASDISKMNTKYNVWAPPAFILGLRNGLLLAVFLLLTGCEQSNAETSSAGNIRGYNHVAGQNVNWFSVNGYSSTLNGNSCCVMIPDKWRPGLIAHIEWEVDPNADEKIPRRKEGFGFDQKAYALHKAKYRQYSADVSIPKYDQSAGISVHFLPCHQVKVYAGEASYGAEIYPIKEPMNMKEPATCPK
ncbi:hypothetical protein electrica_01102 [Klebsiella electrica]|uniref:DUF3304 domain-containing protein n=1 Tax=Klebsiella electrica TaxID=1259973 RepID=UPI00116278F7|nr:DUF3304 domain-containing protein [Klebsiella electrica]QDI07310.1 hypothetical protein electrica_01102 [Klebsiella electrica]